MTDKRDRLLSAFLSAALTALAGYALLLGLRVPLPQAATETLALFDVTPPPPRPEPTVPPPRPSTRPAGRAAPPNLRARPKEVVAPEPVVTLPIPVPAAPPVADAGPATTSGAADRPGPGTGAGGVGDGRGAGGSGNGEGGGRVSRRFRHLSGGMEDDDLPEWMAEAGMRGLVVFRFTVAADGRVSACRVTESSGHPALDALTCRLFTRRLRYRPSLDGAGRPMEDSGTGEQGWGVD